MLQFLNRAKRAFGIAELAQAGPFDEIEILAQIREHKLVARTCDGRLIILADDWERFLKALPRVIASPELRGRARRAPPSKR